MSFLVHAVFVYGTLLAGQPNDIRKMLQILVFLGDGCISGRLYCLGDYPGVVLDEHGAAVVRGELYGISGQGLAQLDALEEIGAAVSGPMRIGRHAGDEYQRVRALCRLDRTQEEMKCWIYELRQPYLSGARFLPRGDWRFRGA